MKNHTGKTRSFYQLSRGWPEQRNSPNRDRYLDEIMIGFYAPSGASSGEFAIRWYDVGKDIMPRLEAFDDSWHALSQCSDLIAALAQHDSETITPSMLCMILTDLGFVDRTPINRP
jgi:hypothetical protein